MSAIDLKELEKKKQELKEQYMRSLITKREAAKELGCSCSTIDRMRSDALIVSKKVRGRIMITVSELARVLIEG
jgi:hypothetical protein